MIKNNKFFKKGIFLIFLLFVLSASECEFDFSSRDPCLNDPDTATCYQNLAVERGNPSYCENIIVEDSSNLQKDKCYQLVAQSTGNASHCNNIVGGDDLYERKDCIMDIAVDTKNFEACDMLRGSARKECYENIGKNVKINDLLDTLDRIKQIENELIYSWRDKELTAKLNRELEELKKKQDLMYENADPVIKRDYFRSQREKLFDDIDDPELKSMIAKDFTDYRGNNKDATITELLEKMESIKEEKETIQRLDQEANKLIDNLKNNIIDYGSGKAQEAVDEVSSAAWEWTFSKGSNEMKYKMSRLEEMKNKYDKASAQYKALSDKIEKFKKVYDEVTEIQNKVNQFNKLLAEGKIEEGHAEVLKGAVFLGKGLEYATSYVPVFGSTMSTVSKETFDATVKFATKRAHRTTALNKCIEDPLNCDPNGISAY